MKTQNFGVEIELTGITPLDLLAAPAIGEVLPRFIEYIGASTLVGQNIIDFDLPICNHWAKQLGLSTIANPTMDKYLFGHKYHLQYSNHKQHIPIPSLLGDDIPSHKVHLPMPLSTRYE